MCVLCLVSVCECTTTVERENARVSQAAVPAFFLFFASLFFSFSGRRRHLLLGSSGPLLEGSSKRTHTHARALSNTHSHTPSFDSVSVRLQRLTDSPGSMIAAQLLAYYFTELKDDQLKKVSEPATGSHDDCHFIRFEVVDLVRRGEGRRGGKCSTRMSLRGTAAGDVDRPASGECFRSVWLLGAVKQTGGCEEAGWGRGRESCAPRSPIGHLRLVLGDHRERHAVNSLVCAGESDVVKSASPQPIDAHELPRTCFMGAGGVTSRGMSQRRTRR